MYHIIHTRAHAFMYAHERRHTHTHNSQAHTLSLTSAHTHTRSHARARPPHERTRTTLQGRPASDRTFTPPLYPAHCFIATLDVPLRPRGRSIKVTHTLHNIIIMSYRAGDNLMGFELLYSSAREKIISPIHYNNVFNIFNLLGVKKFRIQII